MSRTIAACCMVVMLLSVCLPVVRAADSNEQFRQRQSAANDDVVTSDVVEEVRFGREVAARVIARFGLYENDALMKYVNLIGRGLAQSTNRPEIEFRFAILNTDEINGYATPGGYIFLTKGAVKKMQDEAELAGALAHEIGHVVEKHAVKELNIKGTDDSATSGLAHLVGGSSESTRAAFAQAVDKALDKLFKDGYKREDETQADKDAVVFCALAGYDPYGLARYFERLNAIKGGKQTEVIDRTHPSFESRIALIKTTISEEGIDTGSTKINKERFAVAMKGLK
jgi:predicted Zn-dependent protease